MKTIMAIGAGFLCGMAWGVTGVSTNDANYLVVHVEEGEDYSFNDKVVGVSGVVKTGPGRAAFTVANSNFTGTVEVDAGILATTAAAFGKPCKSVAIAAGAAYRHEGPGSAAQWDNLYENLFIAGSGPDGQGCFRYVPSSSHGCPDGTVKNVTLTGDALLATDAYRWGINGTFSANGHWLTLRAHNGKNFISSSANWNAVGGGGVIADCTSENQTSHSFNGSEGTFVVNTNRTFTFYYWTGKVEWPFHFREGASLSAYRWHKSGGVWAGPIVLDGTTTFRMDSYDMNNSAVPQHWYFKGPISGTGKLRCTGGANMWFQHSGNVADGGTDVAGSILWADASGSIPGWDVPNGIRLTSGYLNFSAGDTIRSDSDAAWTGEALAQALCNVQCNNTTPRVFTPKTTTVFDYTSSSVTNFQHCGPGRLVFKKTFDAPCVYYVNRGGETRMDGEDQVFAFNTLHCYSGTVSVASGTTTARDLHIRGPQFGVLRQTGGVLQMQDARCIYVTATDHNQGGALLLDGGTLEMSAGVIYAGYPNCTNGTAIFRQTGGNLLATSTTATSMQIGGAGDAAGLISGGTNNLHATYNSQTVTLLVGTGAYNGKAGRADFTIDGTNTLVDHIGVRVGSRNAVVSTNILNVTGGATLKARRLRKECGGKSIAVGAENPDVPAGWWLSSTDTAKARTLYYPYTNAFSVVNLDNAVLMPTFGWAWNGIDERCTPSDIDHTVVWEGGVIFDTSECWASGVEGAAGTGKALSYFTHPLSSPSGRGVDSITPPAVVLSASYEAPPIVRIDGDGWGASAFADWDAATKRVTGIRVYGRGCDYSSATATIDSPDRKVRHACTVLLSENGVGGGVTKRGAQKLYFIRVNTYSGPTRCLEGEMAFYSPESVPTNSWLVPAAKATIQMPNASTTYTVKSVGGAGTIGNGSLKVTAGLVQESETLLAGGSLTIAKSLVFGEGATVSVDKPQKLIDSGRQTWPLVTASAISGTPVLDSSMDSRFWLISTSTRVTLHYLQGTMLIFR